jgi:MFS family permease
VPGEEGPVVVAGSGHALRDVARNPGLTRAIAAYATFNFGEWATWIAVLVYAYQRGGATESGIVACVMLVPSAIFAPIAAGLAERSSRERALLVSYVAQAVAMAATAVALLASGPSPLVYLLATTTSMTVALTRPAHGAILPSLAMTPAQLTAANVASGTVQNLAIMAAPAVAGLVLAAAGAGQVFVITAIGVAVGAALVAGIRTEPDILTTDDILVGNLRELPLDVARGLGVLLRLPGPRIVVALIGAAAVIEGALDVLVIVLAIDVVGTGEAGVGLLSSAAGFGGVMGAAAAMSLVGRKRLARPFVIGLLLWGAPIGLVGLVPSLVVAVAVLSVAGVGRAVLDVAGRTLLQRVTPDEAMSRAFGVLESAYMAMIAVGSIAVPAVIAIAGPRQALILVGAWLPLVVLLSWRALRSVDAAAVVHVRELELLRGISMFAPLPPPTIERLSASLVPVSVPAGAWAIREGDVGDRYYIIEAGTAEVFVGDLRVGSEGPGDAFGEIALLRDVPRTASVRAQTDLTLLALERDVFLAAIGRHAQSRATAEAVVATRLAEG